MKANTEVLSSHRIVPQPHECGFRCGCGSLLAKRVPEGIELKCRRCKSMTIIPLVDDWSTVEN